MSHFEVSASNIAFLESFRWMRKEFISRALAGATASDVGAHAALQQDAAYQLSEFYYLIYARQLHTADQIRIFANLHNDYIVGLLDDPQKMKRLGLTKPRILDAIFTSDTLPRLVKTWKDRPGAVDQSNLARFLVATMSAETCRKTVVALTGLGFLERATSPYGSILVVSNGRLERLLESCIADARARYQSESDREG